LQLFATTPKSNIKRYIKRYNRFQQWIYTIDEVHTETFGFAESSAVNCTTKDDVVCST